MSPPRTKRPFAGAASDPAQRQITSFFSTGATAPTNPSIGDALPHSRPVLPADTQANLLNVGMRVRKSVPEGYKTGTYSAFGLFEPHDTISSNIKKGTVSAPVTVPRPTPAINTQRELLPFCGINKIGGLSTQPSFEAHVTLPAPSIDDVPSLSSSQASVSSFSGPSSQRDLSCNRKRIYDDSEESDTPSVSECLQIPSGEWLDGQVSPRSLVPAGWENTRVMAVPKKNRRSSKFGSVPTLTVPGASAKIQERSGQENMAIDDDFPEADFLDYQALEGEAMDI